MCPRARRGPLGQSLAHSTMYQMLDKRCGVGVAPDLAGVLDLAPQHAHRRAADPLQPVRRAEVIRVKVRDDDALYVPPKVTPDRLRPGLPRGPPLRVVEA